MENILDFCSVCGLAHTKMVGDGVKAFRVANFHMVMTAPFSGAGVALC